MAAHMIRASNVHMYSALRPRPVETNADKHRKAGHNIALQRIVAFPIRPLVRHPHPEEVSETNLSDVVDDVLVV